MALQIHAPPSEVIEKIRQALSTALPCDALEVRGSGGHFAIRVVSSAFAGKNALAHLMKGDDAPVHAIDELETLAP